MEENKWLPWTTNMLDDDLVKKVLEVYQIKEYKKGQFVFEQGELSDQIYLLLQGRIEINMVSVDGKKTIFSIHEPRCFFGELIMDHSPRLTSAVCLTNVTAAALDSSLNLGSDYYEKKLYQALFYSTSRKLKIQIQQLSDQVFEEAEERIEKLLLALCKNFGKEESGQVQVDLPLTHQMIADLTGCSRPTVSQIISDLAKKDKLSMERNKIIFKKHP
ncbi:Crp/Fnr family transcriptional regulator [Desulfitobacterium chlororespirans]|uniref:cAMP-binding domain of CRP or a regulatory subunit of cAMP-dependent protein kinases n=1 Tax=Desulfitobacterium chlororespirans DSM 11544 TaxID=1121395 RepID=A0A1M7TWR7_9FIRM|nr:Crp/Fnr family transcriptional regulator [Desulfitobacterium chlororespirans]SHN75130.1 cAMP-binding domain of CRP or a regulatory subunit of cAMP-dependent protein kinases [Desulfitobacterium chlororespirans DSM 11544]